MKTIKPIIIKLDKLVYGGEAMGHLEDGRAVFVPYTLPGEVVRIQLVEERGGYARAELLEVIQAEAERTAPKCKHFFSLTPYSSPVGRREGVRVCGGCQYQHMPYSGQLKAKTEILSDQLTRIGHIQHPPVHSIIASPESWNYRNQVQFHLDEDGRLGFQAAKSNRVIPISECHLPEAPINALWPQIEVEAIPDLERLSLRLGANEDLMLILESRSMEPPEMEIEAGISVVHLWPGGMTVLAGSDHLLMEVCGRTFQVSAGSFFQVNTRMAEALVTHLLEILPLPVEMILEVYCGAGLFSTFFAPQCKRLIGIEASQAACEDFMINLDEFDHVELYEAAAEEALPALEVRPDIIVVDPPRAGLDRRVLDAILAMGATTLAYISCDPSTLGRDAARLTAGGYVLKQVIPFDLFPQTYHIESLSLFIK